MPYSIAIDGPAGAGKSTVARAVAKELSYIYVDTGAMYRALGLFFVRKDVDIRDESAVVAGLPEVNVSIAYAEDGSQQVYLNGEDVSAAIRTQQIGDAASTVSQYQPVRDKLVALQKQLASETSVVMDGRDIGTKVLPHANLKIYLTASVEVRARRRALELQEKGMSAELSQIEKEVAERDYRDMHRENSPLMQADDAVLVDSSEMTLDETIDRIIALSLGGVK